ncbi:hypothetical protein V6N11_048059 [Hibiscus sabdariffa]|uniref:Uncharacterized protein n=2 Tax=Hibiscus sabdariffa TaxID=183260 RepID=A0ABR2CCG8_9ROSI
MSSPQISEDSLECPRVLGDGSVSLFDVVNGRPSDRGVLVPVPTRLEHVANPISEEDKQVVKRSRGERDEVMDVREDGEPGLNHATDLVDSVAGGLCDKKNATATNDAGFTKSSFRDMLTGRRSEGLNAPTIPELDVEINDEDV